MQIINNLKYLDLIKLVQYNISNITISHCYNITMYVIYYITYYVSHLKFKYVVLTASRQRKKVIFVMLKCSS